MSNLTGGYTATLTKVFHSERQSSSRLIGANSHPAEQKQLLTSWLSASISPTSVASEMQNSGEATFPSVPPEQMRRKVSAEPTAGQFRLHRLHLSCSSSSQVEFAAENAFCVCAQFFTDCVSVADWLDALLSGHPVFVLCVKCKDCYQFRCVAVMHQCKMKKHVFPRMEVWKQKDVELLQSRTSKQTRQVTSSSPLGGAASFCCRHHRDMTISLEDWGSHTNTQNKCTRAGTQLTVCSHQNMKLFQKWESHLNKWIKAPAAAQRDAQVKQVKQNIWHISCTAAIMRSSVKYCSLGLFSKSNKCVRQSELQPLSGPKHRGAIVTENHLMNFQTAGVWSDHSASSSASSSASWWRGGGRRSSVCNWTTSKTEEETNSSLCHTVNWLPVFYNTTNHLTVCYSKCATS